MHISTTETISILWKLFSNPILKHFQMESEIESIPFQFFKIYMHFDVFVSPINSGFSFFCHICFPRNSSYCSKMEMFWN